MTTQAFLYDDSGPFLYIGTKSRLDYTEDWSRWLAGDAISAISVTVSDGTSSPPIASLSVSSFTATTVTAWVISGTVNNPNVVGAVITVDMHITTAAGRVDDRSFRLKVVDR